VDFLVVAPSNDETTILGSQRGHPSLRGLRVPNDVLVEPVRKLIAARNSKLRWKRTLQPRPETLWLKQS